MILLPGCRCCDSGTDCEDFLPPNAVTVSYPPDAVEVSSNDCETEAIYDCPPFNPTNPDTYTVVTQCSTDAQIINDSRGLNLNVGPFIKRDVFGETRLEYFHSTDIDDRFDCIDIPIYGEMCQPFGSQISIKYKCTDSTFRVEVQEYLGSITTLTEGCAVADSFDPVCSDAWSFLGSSRGINLFLQLTASIDILEDFLDGTPLTESNVLNFRFTQGSGTSLFYGITPLDPTFAAAEKYDLLSYQLLNTNTATFSLTCS